MKKHCLLVAAFAAMAMTGWSGDKEIIVESFSDGLNSQGFSPVEGRWNDSATKSTAPGLQASQAVYNDANNEPATARFTPDIPVAGKYEVFMTYPPQGNANDIKYTVVSSDGTKETTITQFGRSGNIEPLPNTWFSLGTYNFAAGTAGHVDVSDPLIGLAPMPAEHPRIYADAIKFVPVGFELPADYVNKSNKSAAPATAVAADTPAPMPGMAAIQAPAPTPGLPQLPAATPVTVAAANLPALPSDSSAANAPAVGLPALPAATPAGGGLPSLPGNTPPPGAGLPPLPESTPPATGGLPTLPTDSAPAAGLPALPSATPAVSGLPGLPPTTSAGSGLPDLPASPGASATPIPPPNLPSLAPVTPTPGSRLPSPAETPIANASAGLPPLPGPGMPDLPTGPLATPVASGLPPLGNTPPASTTITDLPGGPAPVAPTSSAKLSISQYNPSGLQWMYDFGAALNTARTQNKKVLVFFTASGNQVASKYETEYFNTPAMKQALNDYVLVKVDFPKNTRLGYSLRIYGAGNIAVTDNIGNVTARIEQLPATPADLIRQMAADKPASKVASDADAGAGATGTTGLAPLTDAATSAPEVSAPPPGIPAVDGATLPPPPPPAAPDAPSADAGLPELPSLPMQ